MSIKENLEKIHASLPQGIKLVVVSKTRNIDEILEAYNAGQRAFGENKAQELLMKQKDLPRDIEWHLIGHLQSNKVRSIVPYVSLIHSIDSLKLLQIIDLEARLAGRVIKCLFQLHIAREETKFGFSYYELNAIMASPEFSELKNIVITGVMGMATFTDNTVQIKQEFSSLHRIFIELKEKDFKNDPDFREISMGMSDDYTIAVEEGSTMVRIGSKIFGPRTKIIP